jgi:4-amino-4-deoxychorismate lyase
MKVLYDERIIDEAEFSLPFSSRAWRYGDGIFETMTLRNGEIWHWPLHWQRLSNAMSVLGLIWNKEMTWQNFTKEIEYLLDQEKIVDGVVKIYVWRSGGGKYKPDTDLAEYCIAAESINHMDHKKTVPLAGFCTQVQNMPSPYSHFKRLNSLHYVLAAREMKAHGWGEIILCDYDDNVSEALYSNIFWYTKGRFYTPSLGTGCIEGTFRSAFIQYLKKSGIPVDEVKSKPGHMLSADSVFTTNAGGVQIIKQIGGHTFDMPPVVDDYLNELVN